MIMSHSFHFLMILKPWLKHHGVTIKTRENLFKQHVIMQQAARGALLITEMHVWQQLKAHTGLLLRCR